MIDIGIDMVRDINKYHFSLRADFGRPIVSQNVHWGLKHSNIRKEGKKNQLLPT